MARPRAEANAMSEMNETNDLAAARTSVEPETRLPPTNGGDAFQTRLLAKNDKNAISRQSQGQDVASTDGDTISNGNKPKYEYVGEIAQGGMGRIVAVRDRSLRRRVAMKLLISPNGKVKRQEVNRLLAEAQTTGQLEHPNIVPIHDVGIYQDDKYYFTMKLVKGTTLRKSFVSFKKKKEKLTSNIRSPVCSPSFNRLLMAWVLHIRAA
jgi:serine/threonine protein kinase